MKTTDIFAINRNSKKLNESMEKLFGKKLNLESFDLTRLEDARNKLRTQISQVRSSSEFNENLENDAYHKARFMLDAINAEISEREQISAKENAVSEESQGEEMQKVTEGELQQAQSIVTAKTMVDRVGRWIEELSGMENDTLLQLGDQIRDEMGQEQAKRFISTVAPAIQQALENLKQARETLASGVRTLTGEEQGAEMLGAEPQGDVTSDELGAAKPDAMNAGAMDAELGAADDFAAAEPAAGPDAAGREKRESIQFENKLLKVLAG